MFSRYFLSRAPEVLIEITKPKNGRRVQLLSAILSTMNMRHAVRIPFWRPGLLPGAMHRRLAKTNCPIVWRSPPPERLYVTDSPNKGVGQKRIILSYDTKSLFEGNPDQGALVLPIMFNPSLLNPAGYAEAERLSANTERPIKIIFAGNCDPKAYDAKLLADRYGLLSRHRLHMAVKQMFGDAIFVPTSFGHLLEAARSGELWDRFVWIDTSQFSVPMSAWLETLSMSQYFFCAPGVAYPYCHNFNESIACGCVPILQYDKWIFPRLAHAANCFAFDGLDDLRELVNGLFSGAHDARWSEMSRAIVGYHQTHLSFAFCMSQIQAFIDDPGRQEMTWIMAGKE